MLKKLLGAVVFLTFATLGYAQQNESLTLTTYYPSPYGYYNELTVMSKLGVGTTNPSEKLELYDGTLSLRTSDAVGSRKLHFHNLNNWTSDIYLNSSNNLQFDLYGALNALVIEKNTGNVGIGVPTPSAKLQIGGTSGVDGIKFPDGTLQTTAGGIPAGFVGFFNLSSCPSGWSEFTAAQGRYIVGKPSGGTLAGTAGTALSNLENRAAGAHTHGFIAQQYYGSQTELGAYGNSYGNIAQSAQTDSGGLIAGTNAPYIQLLVCQKD